MAEGGNGGSRRSRWDDDEESVEKTLDEACEAGQRTNANESFPPDHNRGTLAQRSADLESGVWRQESAVPSTIAGPHPSVVGSAYNAQVNNCQGVHLGSVIHHHHHYAQRELNQEGHRVSSQTQGGATPPNSASPHANTNEAQIRLVMENSGKYRSYCHNRTKDHFVTTTPYDQARKEIENKNAVLLLGGIGDGKSSIIQYIVANPMNDYHPVSCSDPEEIQQYINLIQGTNIKLLFVFDDPVGGSYTQQHRVDAWVHMLRKLERYLTQSEHKFLFAMRKAVWSDCEVHFAESTLFGNQIEVTSVKLSPGDKVRMLDKHLGNSGKLTDWDKRRIVTDKTPIAFGQCCKLVSVAIGLSSADLVHIFHRPFSYLGVELEKMAATEKEKYATLCLVMLCGGTLECNQLSGTLSEVEPDVKERIVVVADVCGCPNLTCGGLQKCADKLIGTYLEKLQAIGEDPSTSEVYTFSHDAVHEAVTMHYGQLHPGHCLKYLNPDVIVKIARPPRENCTGREHEFVITLAKKNYKQLAGIFTRKVIDENGKWGLGEVFDNPCVKDEQFQSVWIDYLRNSSPDKRAAFGESRGRDGPRDCYDRCVLYYLSKSGALKILSLLSADHQFECKCRCVSLPCVLRGAVEGDQAEVVSSYLFLHTMTRREVRDAVCEACADDSVHVLRILLSSQTITRNEVSGAVYMACINDSGHALSVLMSSHKMTRDEVRDALTAAFSNDSVHVLSILFAQIAKEDRTDVTESGLETACAYGRVRSVEYLLTQWWTPCTGPDCPCVTGLFEATYLGRPDIVRLIISSHGQNVNTVNVEGDTSLHVAAWYGPADVINFLISNGAELNARNKHGQTPLDLAVRRCLPDVEKILLSKGAQHGDQ